MLKKTLFSPPLIALEYWRPVPMAAEVSDQDHPGNPFFPYAKTEPRQFSRY